MATTDYTKRSVRTPAAVETRVSLVLALAAQTSSLSQRCKESLLILFDMGENIGILMFYWSIDGFQC